MFLRFFYTLREAGLKVSVGDWLTLMQALIGGHGGARLMGLYRLGRALLVKREADFDVYDRVFAHVFEGVEDTFSVDDELLSWLQNPILPRQMSAEDLANLQSLDLDTLREEFEKRLKEQDERHDGGSHWIGTGGTSPFGHGGHHPSGVRVGGQSKNRSAVQVASERRFQNLRGDATIDVRQFGMALKKLRRLGKDGPADTLDIDASIDATCKQGGEIELVFAPDRKNRVKLLLLMDVGGSMDAHAHTCERLFSAAHKANHFKSFTSYFFHNCVYDHLFEDISVWRGPPTKSVVEKLDVDTKVIIVGDAWMSPYELTHPGGAIRYGDFNDRPGLYWLGELRRRFPASVWLNPEPRKIWPAASIHLVRQVFPMFELTLDGLDAAIRMLRGQRPNRPDIAPGTPVPRGAF